jgi:RNA polymerase primary sigma factor
MSKNRKVPSYRLHEPRARRLASLKGVRKTLRPHYFWLLPHFLHPPCHATAPVGFLLAKNLPRRESRSRLWHRLSQSTRRVQGLPLENSVPRTLSRPASAPFHHYLREINATSLLDADEERDLAHRVEGGDPEARDHMVRANLRLVVSLAKRYVGKGLAMEDLVAEGNLGLLRAAERFDPLFGVRFSTYAAYWVKQSIRKALGDNTQTVRLPQYTRDLLARWRRSAAALRVELGREPSHEEVAWRLGLSAKRLAIMRKALRVHGAAAQGGEDGTVAGVAALGVLASGASPSAELEGAEETRQVLGLLDRMDQRRAAVLRLRFGLAGERPMTLKEVGGRLGLTRERVRQIEIEALADLRARLGE